MRVAYALRRLSFRMGRLSLVLIPLLAILLAGRAEARYASIVIDAATGKVLEATSADAANYPASLTKMMTLYLLFEAVDKGRLTLDQALPVSNRAALQPATDLGLRAGATITVEEAIHALVIQSANDVAVVVAEALADSESAFAKQMTAKARRLGMTRTVFRNASGLPDNGQQTTARELATLARALVKVFPHHYHYFSTTRFRYGGRTYTTHNRILRTYAGADGLKTGYIRASGYNLAGSALRGGHRVIAVVMGGTSPANRDKQMAQLLDQGFAQLEATDPSIEPAPLVASAGTPGQKLLVPAVKPDSGLQPTAVQLAERNAAKIQSEDPVAQQGSVVAAIAEELAEELAPSANAAAVASPARVLEEVPLADQPKAKTKQPAAAQAKAKPTKTAQAKSSTKSKQAKAAPAPRGGWHIQVGAFAKMAAAKKAAVQATKTAPDALRSAEIRIDEASGKKKLYRAQLVGLTEKQARSACQKLRAKDGQCLVVRSAGVSMAELP